MPLACQRGELEAVERVEQTPAFGLHELYLMSDILHGLDLVIIGYIACANVGICGLRAFVG